ncbi:MAG: hypothetical protein JNM68_01555 [Dinghuibacter sp.]|nr:hypothetical protein [Dinghuibacter sp.]
MKKLFLAFLVLSGFLLTSAQIKDAGMASPLPPGAMGNAELFVCEDAAKTATTLIDKSRFKNFESFTTNSTFTVPTGITEVLIEMWGAGGGGHFPGGGGGSGGYWLGLIPVTAGTSVILTIGLGGVAGTHSTPGGTGANTSFTCPGFNVATGGGLGADSVSNSSFEAYRGGRGGVGGVVPINVPSGFKAFISTIGQAGTGSFVDFVQMNATTFARKFTAGVGGIAPFSGQPSNTVITSLDPLGTGRTISGTSGILGVSSFGSGGNCTTGTATGGGPGRVIIYF